MRVLFVCLKVGKTTSDDKTGFDFVPLSNGGGRGPAVAGEAGAARSVAGKAGAVRTGPPRLSEGVPDKRSVDHTLTHDDASKTTTTAGAVLRALLRTVWRGKGTSEIGADKCAVDSDQEAPCVPACEDQFAAHFL